MRFSSGAPTTPTTTTSIDLIDSAQGKRGSNSGVMQAPNAPIQVVEVDNVQLQQLNGGTPHQEEPQPQTPASDKVQPSIVVAISSTPYGGSDGSQTLPDDEGIV
jgi:hypothetical protein